MVWYLSIKVAGTEVDNITVRYSETPRGQVLEKIFPRECWSVINGDAVENPPEFDFIGKWALAQSVVADYVRVAGSDPDNQYWVNEFFKTYHVGKALQELGLHPKVSIG